MSEEVIRTVDAYLSALAAKDISAAPLHSDVTFESPLSPLIQGFRRSAAGFCWILPCDEGNQCQPTYREW